LTQELYPGLRGNKVEASRIGVRPIPIDGLPVLGRSATVENSHFAVTHSGVTLCLRIAELVGAEVRGVSWSMSWHRSGTRGWTLDSPRRCRSTEVPTKRTLIGMSERLAFGHRSKRTSRPATQLRDYAEVRSC
jgi:hypothetical protein